MSRAYDRPTHSAELDRRDDADLKAVQKQVRQMEDAYDLVAVARIKWPDDDLGALGWVAYVWRRTPDAWETVVRQLAIEMLRDDLSDADRETWDRVGANRETMHCTPVSDLIDAVTAKHEVHHERHQEPLHIGAADHETIDRLRAA